MLFQPPIARPTGAITYTYDPRGRLIEADYSTGESYEYQYDAVGNRTSLTSVTPPQRHCRHHLHL